MFCNGVECISGILVFQDVVNGKEWFGDTGFNREADKQRASVSGIGNQSKLLYLPQIS
jgi:hypothetical protein